MCVRAQKRAYGFNCAELCLGVGFVRLRELGSCGVV